MALRNIRVTGSIDQKLDFYVFQPSRIMAVFDWPESGDKCLRVHMKLSLDYYCLAYHLDSKFRCSDTTQFFHMSVVCGDHESDALP